MEELDAQFGISDIFETDKKEKMNEMYTGKNLLGLTVQHDIESFVDERDVILTLKDKGVLDEDGSDILVNVNMLDDERYKKVRNIIIIIIIIQERKVRLGPSLIFR